MIDQKTKDYFQHWLWSDNIISQEGKLYLINLEYALMVKFDYGDAYFADFEDFESQISDMQFLRGDRPDEEKVHSLLVDAWNFMGIQERIEDGFGLEDINDDIFTDEDE